MEDGVPLLLRSASGLRVWHARLDDTVGQLLNELHRSGEDGQLSRFGRPLMPERRLSSYGIHAMSEVQLSSGGLLGGGLCQSTPTDSDSDAGTESSSEGSSPASHGSNGSNANLAPEDVRWQSFPNTDRFYIPQPYPPRLTERDLAQQFLEDWHELQELETFMRLLATRGHAPAPHGIPGAVPSGWAAFLSLAPELAGRTPPQGLYFTNGPGGLRFIPVPWRLRITAFDVDAMGYEELLQLAEDLGSVPHPRATPEMLQRLPLFRYSGGDKDKCVICQEAYELGDEVRKLPCSHTYHKLCIDRWLTTGSAISLQCPICKAPALE